MKPDDSPIGAELTGLCGQNSLRTLMSSARFFFSQVFRFKLKSLQPEERVVVGSRCVLSLTSVLRGAPENPSPSVLLPCHSSARHGWRAAFLRPRCAPGRLAYLTKVNASECVKTRRRKTRSERRQRVKRVCAATTGVATVATSQFHSAGSSTESVAQRRVHYLWKLYPGRLMGLQLFNPLPGDGKKSFTGSLESFYKLPALGKVRSTLLRQKQTVLNFCAEV